MQDDWIMNPGPARSQAAWPRSRRIVVALFVAVATLLGPLEGFAQSYSGSGFEVSDEGHFLTNHHVVANCKAIHVKQGQL